MPHTPGPLLVSGNRIDTGKDQVLIVDEKGLFVANVTAHFRPAEEVQANGHLFAVAPEMLELAEFCLVPDQPVGSDAEYLHKIREKAKAIVAKAKGD